MVSTRDTAAFDAFVLARSGSLYRTAYLMVGQHQSAQDLVQEALVKTLLAWPRLRDHSTVEAYARRIIVTTSVSWRRRRSFHERPTERLPEPPVLDSLASGVATHEDLMAALRTLSPRQRAVIVLRYYQDLTEAQTAEALGCSVGAVKSHAFTGLRRLRASLGDLGSVAPSEPEVRS